MIEVVATSAFDLLLQGRIIDAVVQVYMDALGPMAPAILVGAIAASLYIDAKSLVFIAVVAMLAGGLMVGYLPAPAQNVGRLVIFAGVVLAALRVYVSRGSRV